MIRLEYTPKGNGTNGRMWYSEDVNIYAEATLGMVKLETDWQRDFIVLPFDSVAVHNGTAGVVEEGIFTPLDAYFMKPLNMRAI